MADSEREQVYVESLRWRRGELESKIAAAREKVEALTKQEASLREELRAIEQLLFATNGTAQKIDRGAEQDSEVRSEGQAQAGPVTGLEPNDLVGYGPTAQKIYACADQVIREAGVPLHYRVLADEVQRRVPLAGKDPGATLIAHLHRAQDLFPRVGRGVYGVKGMVALQPQAEEPDEASTPPKRRRRTQRRRTR